MTEESSARTSSSERGPDTADAHAATEPAILDSAVANVPLVPADEPGDALPGALPNDPSRARGAGRLRKLGEKLGALGARVGTREVRVWGLVLAFVWLCTWAFVPLFGPLQLIGPAVTAAVLLPPLVQLVGRAWRAFRRRRVAPWVEGTIVSIVFVVAAMVLFDRVVFKDTIIDQGDNAIMRARGQLIAAELARGELAQWSQLFQGGDTLVDLHPNVFTFLSVILHLFMPNGVPFAKTYSLFCVLVWAFRGIAVYTICRRFSGPLIALIVAFVSLFDIGRDHMDGTWLAYFRWGVVHSNLALTWVLFAMAAQIDLCRRTSLKPIIVLVISAMLAVVTHLLGILMMSVVCCALLLATAASQGRRRRPLWALLFTVLGVGAGAFWVLPYTHGMQQFSFSGPAGGFAYSDYAQGFLDGNTPYNSFQAFYGVVIVAIVASLASRDPLRMFSATVVLLLLALSLTTWLVQSHVVTYFSGWLEGQQRRAWACAKIAAFPVVAALFAQLASRVRFSTQLRFGAVAAHSALLIVCVSCFGRPANLAFVKLREAMLSQVPTGPLTIDGIRTNGTSAEHVAAMRWVAAKRKADPSPTPWRVALWGRDDGLGHKEWFWAQGVDMGVPVVDFGWTSSNFLTNRPREFTAEGLRTWNIRYIVTPLGDTPFAGATLRHTESSYRIWEVDQHDDRFVVAPDGVRISNVKASGNDVWFDVEGAGSGADVQVRTAYYPRWSAEQNGRRIEVRPRAARAGRVKEDQLALFVRDGRVRVSFGAPPPRFWLGFAVSVVSLLATVMLFSARRRAWINAKATFLRARVRRIVLALRERRRVRRGLIAGAVASALAFVAVGVFAGGRRLLPAPIEGWGLRVTAHQTNFGPLVCNPLIREGMYKCMKDDRLLAEVNAALGGTPINDHAGEWMKLWPGTRVLIYDSATTVTLEFSRLALAGRPLHFRTHASGGIEAVLHSGSYRSPPFKLEATETRRVDFPPGIPSRLSVELKPLRDNAWVVFSGKL